MTDIRSRLALVLGDRKITPWAKKLGIGSATQQSLQAGGPIESAQLTIVQHTENVSLSWLLDGKGRPFLVSEFDDDDEALEYVQSLLADENWRVKLAAAPGDVVIVLHQPGSILRGKKKDILVEYEVVELISGATEKALLHMGRRADTFDAFDLAPHDVRRLARGAMGSHELFGPADKPRPTSAITLAAALDMARLAAERPYLTPDERIVLDHYRAMDSAGKTAFKSVGTQMAKQAGHAATGTDGWRPSGGLKKPRPKRS